MPKILLVAATPFEIAPTLNWLETTYSRPTPDSFLLHSLEIKILITGVGMTATAFHLGRTLAIEPPDLLINAGIAGAFDRRLKLGDVRMVTETYFGDLGAETAEGGWLDVFDLGLVQPNESPFSGRKLVNPQGASASFLPAARSLTVNTVHGTAQTIQKAQQYFPDAELETMESAAVFFCALQYQTPFLEIRAVSNYVEPRNRDLWNIPLSITNLNQVVIEMLRSF